MKQQTNRLQLVTVGFSLLVATGRLAPTVAQAAPRYVDFGDSLTTGSTIATCQEDRATSPWGCTEAPQATPYAVIVAQRMNWSFSNKVNDNDMLRGRPAKDLLRTGIWGYTLQEAVATDRQPTAGRWLPQLQAIRNATDLVTGSLGINDLHFSDVTKWARLYLSSNQDRITPAVQAIIQQRSADFDQLFSALSIAHTQGAKVVLGLYYNPYSSGDQECSDLQTIAHRLVGTLNQELDQRAHDAGITTVDYGRRFAGHGAGSKHPYVVGTNCRMADALVKWLPAWLAGRDANKAVAVAFDPHPNATGTKVMAQQLLEAVNNAD